MPESLPDCLRRKWSEARIKIAKWIIRKSVEWYDRLEHGAFMAYCWGLDEVTDYNVIAERSYPDCHIYGTRVDYYDDAKRDVTRDEESD